MATWHQTAASGFRPPVFGILRNVLKKAYRNHRPKNTIAGMPLDTSTVQNVPWVPMDGPGGAEGLSTFRETGAPKPRIGLRVMSVSDELYNSCRWVSPYPALSRVRM